jgi:hypothetical protein
LWLAAVAAAVALETLRVAAVAVLVAFCLAAQLKLLAHMRLPLAVAAVVGITGTVLMAAAHPSLA